MTDLNDSDNFSPFDQPKKEARVPGMTDNTGMKIERINDSDLDGANKANPAPGSTPFDDTPKDAPVFEIPTFDKVPNAEIPPAAGGGGGSSSGGGGSSTGQGSTKMDPDFAKGLSEFTAKWLVDMYFKLLILGLGKWVKLDKSEIMAEVKAGNIDEKFIKYVDQCNKSVDTNLTVSEDEKKFIIEPLKYYLEVKKVNIKPEYMFLGGLLMISAKVGMKANDIRKENKEILEKIIAESAAIRAKNGGRPSDNVYEEKENFNNNGQTFSVHNDNPEEPVVSYGPGEVEELSHDNAN